MGEYRIGRHVYMAAYRAAHKEEISDKRKAYRLSHKDQIKSDRVRRYYTSIDSSKATRRAYYESHRTEENAKSKAYFSEYYAGLSTDEKTTRQERTRLFKYRALGITIEDYERLLVAQDGVCAICRNVDKAGRRLSVDHDHLTGEIRGLLCNGRNRALGLLGDSLEGVRSAMDCLDRANEHS